ncbi:unnamed protein product [Adineta steineri]|uniref:G-protein coupled receptors family 1 profile domain-containing protein n=1 Tax=Adineta steineri TaxID=433720 RepID=A0A814MB13_9BILA|nr:unnamed protein product [Adineta steineri]CAF3961415.1 unnamed protein product [Adineta steineri]
MQVISQLDQIILNYSNDSLSSSSALQIFNSNIIPTRPFIWTILIAVCLSIIVILTVVGNILVLIALCFDFALRSPTHLLMGNLACADLLLGITVLPFSATLEIFEGKWLFGRIFCHLWLSIDVLYCTASIYGLMFISIERYIGVTRPLRYPIIITHTRTLIAILIAWLISIVVSIAPFLNNFNGVTSKYQDCSVNENKQYVLFSCSFSFYIPLIIILCVYGRIYGEAIRQHAFLSGGEKKVRINETVGQECVTLRIHIPQHLATSTTSLSNTMHSSTTTLATNTRRLSALITGNASNKLSKFLRERKAAKTLGIVVGMFILCWLPFFLLLPIKAWTGRDPGIIFSICFWLGYCNSCFNPFIYAFSSREFRKAFENILKCHRKPYIRTSMSFSRISAATAIDHTQLKKSHSCDITSAPFFRKSDSTISCRTSCDSQNHFIHLTKNRLCLDRPQLSVFQRLSSPNSSKSLTTLHKTNSWHLQEPTCVR